MQLPANISIANARLPQTYEAAKNALANCASIDECCDWANKAEALASYAKQADDETLFKYARRIQTRAVNRAGELLKQYDGSGRNQHSRGAPTKLSQREVARAAGMSKDQQVTAVRLANVPPAKFDELVESDDPPTVTKLAEMGKQSRPAASPPPQPTPDGFKQATHLLGSVKRFAEFCEGNDPSLVANGVLPAEAAQVRRLVSVIDGWLDRFVVNLKDPQ